LSYAIKQVPLEQFANTFAFLVQDTSSFVDLESGKNFQRRYDWGVRVRNHGHRLQSIKSVRLAHPPGLIPSFSRLLGREIVFGSCMKWALSLLATALFKLSN
jgi:hypothetical protein